MEIAEISKYNLAFLRSFFQPLRFTIAVEAILEGSSHGAIWMDNLTHPTLVVLWDFADGIYIVSQEKDKKHLNGINSLFQQTIIPEVEKRDEVPLFVVYISPVFNENEIRSIFGPEWDVSKEKASFYEFPLVEFPSEKQLHELPPSLEGNLMDMDLFQDSSIQYIDVLREEIESDWDSIENFLTHSFGYYIRDLDRNSLASWVIVGKIAQSCAELGIKTVEQYQRQGLGQFAAQELIKYTLERELVPHWYCFQNNVLSANMVKN
ncbi:MAG: GNAT family N-acetyltransferase [Candidatus Thorarchaeota archaeon]|nr:GNAT family N-acetyltransferase [Candidatus Thorarchaeota archaeon]